MINHKLGYWGVTEVRRGTKDRDKRTLTIHRDKEEESRGMINSTSRLGTWQCTMNQTFLSLQNSCVKILTPLL